MINHFIKNNKTNDFKNIVTVYSTADYVYSEIFVNKILIGTWKYFEQFQSVTLYIDIYISGDIYN